MAFKMITLGEKEVGRIAGNAGAHAALMANGLTGKWRQQLPKGQKVIDIHQVQMCVRHDLHRMRDEIAEIEKSHLGRLETQSLSRKVRDETIPRLRGQLVGIQNLFDGNFGAGSSTKVFGSLVTVIPLEPFSLRRVANAAHGRLMAPDFTLPASQLAGVKIVPRELAKGFEEPLAELDRVLVELEDTLPIANASLELKIKALAELRTQVGIAARFLEALYRLAGHDEIARRVRPSSHRSRRLTPPAAEGTGGEEQGSPGDEAVAVVATDEPVDEPVDEEVQAGSPATAEAA